MIQYVFAQPVVENWNTFVDPEKRFTLFYPPNLQAKGKENFLSSTDLILTNPNAWVRHLHQNQLAGSICFIIRTLS